MTKNNSSDIYNLARRKARYGHRDWLVWKDKQGVTYAEVKSEKSITQAIKDTGENGFFSLLEASTGQGHLINNSMAQIMLSNAKYGI